MFGFVGGTQGQGVGCDRRCKAIVGSRILPRGADPKVGGVRLASSDDVYAGTGVVGVGGDGIVGLEVQDASCAFLSSGQLCPGLRANERTLLRWRHGLAARLAPQIINCQCTSERCECRKIGAWPESSHQGACKRWSDGGGGPIQQ